MRKINRHIFLKVLFNRIFEVFIMIEVKDNIEQALRVLKRKQRDGFFKIIKLKNTYEKPSKRKENFTGKY